MSKSPTLFSSDDEEEGLYKEAEVLNKFQMMLQGVPPPSSVTMSRLSVSDMLQKYKENECLFSISSQTLNGINDSHKFNIKKKTPKVVSCLNSSKISEEIANLFQKIQSRYIYSETMTSCNIWFDTAVKTNSAKKRSGRRNGFGLSPGSRLSHLARRRQIFSCENLQKLAISDKRRHIEIKKGNALKSRILERNKATETVKANSFKRALFLSPDEEDTKKGSFSSHSIKRNLFPSSDKTYKSCSGRTFSKEVFNQNLIDESSKKRKRMESREPNGNWPRKALTFSEDDSDKAQESNSRNAKVLSEVQLSLHHKSKLLWAVSVTLKEKNICSKDPQFKTCASALFMICRKNLGQILSSKLEGGTSEKMIHFAREQIGGIFKKLGISRNESSKEEQNVDASHLENNSNFESSSESTKKILDYNEDYKEKFCKKKKANIISNSEAAMAVHTNFSKVQSNNCEKENINISENNSSV